MDVSNMFTEKDLSGAYSVADVIGSISVILPMAVYLVMPIILAVRGKGVSQEVEEEEDFTGSDVNNNKSEFTADSSSNHRGQTSYLLKILHNVKSTSIFDRRTVSKSPNSEQS